MGNGTCPYCRYDVANSGEYPLAVEEDEFGPLAAPGEIEANNNPIPPPSHIPLTILDLRLRLTWISYDDDEEAVVRVYQLLGEAERRIAEGDDAEGEVAESIPMIEAFLENLILLQGRGGYWGRWTLF